MKKEISKTKHLVLSAALSLAFFSASSFTNGAVQECCAAWNTNTTTGEVTVAVRCAETQSKACEAALSAVTAKAEQ